MLSGAAGALAASTLPLLVERVPGGAGELPLPLPLFCAAVAVQMLAVYGLLAWAGLRMARARGLEPAPCLTSLWTGHSARCSAGPAVRSLGVGIAVGAFLTVTVAGVRRFAPSTLPQIMHPPSLASALLATGTAAVGEELLTRLFLLSAILRLLPPSRTARPLAVAISALLFAALHAPGWVFIFGGLDKVPALSWAWVIGLNAVAGAAFGTLYLRFGIGGAILGHFSTDLVWHVGAYLIP